MYVEQIPRLSLFTRNRITQLNEWELAFPFFSILSFFLRHVALHRPFQLSSTAVFLYWQFHAQLDVVLIAERKVFLFKTVGL